ncbi:MAG: isoprenyl transferase [Limnochordia bacterium]
MWKSFKVSRFFSRTRSNTDTQNEEVAAKLARDRLPKHVGVIMDGNGRWAAARGLPRTEGHRQGVHTLREIVRTCGELGIPVLTAYCFSTENWQRPKEEVSFLMQLIIEVLETEFHSLKDEGVRIVAIGRLTDLPETVRIQVEKAAELTAANEQLKLNLAISYGSRLEIVNAVQQLIEKAASGEELVIDETAIAQHLYTAGDPEPDLIIRTGGERRLSNFLLWQAAYAELYFSDIMWPDFTPKDFIEAIAEYQKRDRRFGRIRTGRGLD